MLFQLEKAIHWDSWLSNRILHCFLQDAVGNYYDCRLTLLSAVVTFLPRAFPRGALGSTTCSGVGGLQDPVCTPSGVLYSREAILESLLEQKKGNKRKFAAWKAEQLEELQKVSCFLGIGESPAVVRQVQRPVCDALLTW